MEPYLRFVNQKPQISSKKSFLKRLRSYHFDCVNESSIIYIYALLAYT